MGIVARFEKLGAVGALEQQTEKFQVVHGAVDVGGVHCHIGSDFGGGFSILF